MKYHIKTYQQFESSLFIPRNVESRYDNIKKPYLDMGYKNNEIYIGLFDIRNKEKLLNNIYKVIIGDFECSYSDLTSLKGCPEIVTDSFNCAHNKLTSLEGCPKEVGRNFYCGINNKKFTEIDVRQYCNVKGEIYV